MTSEQHLTTRRLPTQKTHRRRIGSYVPGILYNVAETLVPHTGCGEPQTLMSATYRTGSKAALSLLFLAPLAFGFQPNPQAEAAEALTKQYCAGCHNNRLKSASLSLEGLDLSKVSADAGLWEKVLRKVEAKQMPPNGLPHPSAAAEKAFTKYLETQLDTAAMDHPNPGRPTIHRLNRNEYSNAVRDVLALDIKPGDTLPLDDTGYGFDNIGDVLSLSPVLIERYMSVGRLVARQAIGVTDVKPTVDSFFSVKPVRGGRRNERISDDVPFDSSGGLSFNYSFPVDAEYLFRIKMPTPQTNPTDTAVPMSPVLELRVPVKAGVHHVGLTFMRSGAVPEVLPQLGNGRGAGGGGGGRGGLPPTPLTARLDLRLDGSRLKLYEVSEGNNGPSFNEFSIGGPYNIAGSGNSPSRQRIFVCTPANAAEELPCARKIVGTLGRRAYRRPVTDADIKPLLSFYAAGRKEKDFNNGIEMALRAVLVSPGFLFRVERDPSGVPAGTIHRVNDFELASRMSFFLWSSVPDDQLLGLAEQGRLKDRTVVEQQVARMLDDPKSRAFVSNFSGQWLFLRNLDQVKPDPDVFPEFDPSLRKAFQQETQMFFNAILRDNRPLTEFLDAKYTFLNERLAQFYGIHGVYGPQFRRVGLTDAKRGGLLSQGSILTVTSYPNRTSVVQRGKWVLENLLGTPPPAPPPNIPALDPHGKDGKMTMRQAMEMHRANPVCASCHSRMDPIGFALENFDGIGQWRDKDNGVAIDSSGTLPDGSAFDGAAGLRNALLTAHKDEFIATFTEKLMTYALGRGVEPYDRPAMRAIIREAATQNSTIPAFINAIVGSPQFQMRVSAQTVSQTPAPAAKRTKKS
jgi:mono/diheme cytochrome c family protein